MGPLGNLLRANGSHWALSRKSPKTLGMAVNTIGLTFFHRTDLVHNVSGKNKP
jgi:hypothetical protein